jgi:hypothetical protein
MPGPGLLLPFQRPARSKMQTQQLRPNDSQRSCQSGHKQQPHQHRGKSLRGVAAAAAPKTQPCCPAEPPPCSASDPRIPATPASASSPLPPPPHSAPSPRVSRRLPTVADPAPPLSSMPPRPISHFPPPLPRPRHLHCLQRWILPPP